MLLKQALMKVRLLKPRLSDDGQTQVFVPAGMPGILVDVRHKALAICWDGAYVNNLHADPSEDYESGIFSDWEEENVSPDQVEFIYLEFRTNNTAATVEKKE